LKPASEDTNPHKKDAESEKQQDYAAIQHFHRDLSILTIRVYGEHVLALRRQQMGGKMAMKRKRADEDGDTFISEGSETGY
jgi:tRNA (guanine26-N2/guanine27-N2)-dimethyltransferase